MHYLSKLSNKAIKTHTHNDTQKRVKKKYAPFGSHNGCDQTIDLKCVNMLEKHLLGIMSCLCFNTVVIVC